MAAMSDDQLAAMLAQSGMPGVTPDMAKQAAAMMRSMPPDQLAAMAQAQAAAGFPGAPAAGAPAQPAAPAVSSAAGSLASAGPAAAAAGGSPDQMAAAAEAMKQNPEMLKQARMGAHISCCWVPVGMCCCGASAVYRGRCTALQRTCPPSPSLCCSADALLPIRTCGALS